MKNKIEIELTSLDEYLEDVRAITNSLSKLEKEIELLNVQLHFLTVREVADLMHLSTQAARELFHRKDFPCCNYGKEMVVEKTAFLKYFSKPVKRGDGQ